jgi:hypothetical protein
MCYVRVVKHTQLKVCLNIFLVSFSLIFRLYVSVLFLSVAHKSRGHYSTHHTIIRCNKCFKEFERKTEKNQHQRACTTDVPPPSLEVIDCDKTDELEEVLNTFRTWRLDNEDDEEMKSWIVKYKVEFVNNNMPTDDAHDSRELAKWYRIWRTLFPSLQTPVPSPCKYKCCAH